MLWPVSCRGSGGSCAVPWLPSATAPARISAARRRMVYRIEKLPEGGAARAGDLRLACRDFLLVVLVAHVGDVDPGVRHLIDGAIAPADPLIRIGVVLVAGGVVVPRGDAEHGAPREERRLVLGVDVVQMPVELE